MLEYSAIFHFINLLVDDFGTASTSLLLADKIFDPSELVQPSKAESVCIRRTLGGQLHLGERQLERRSELPKSEQIDSTRLKVVPISNALAWWLPHSSNLAGAPLRLQKPEAIAAPPETAWCGRSKANLLRSVLDESLPEQVVSVLLFRG